MPRSQRPPEERIAELDADIKRKQAERKRILQEAQTNNRKERTKRLIEIGAVVESAAKTVDPDFIFGNEILRKALSEELLRVRTSSSGSQWSMIENLVRNAQRRDIISKQG